MENTGENVLLIDSDPGTAKLIRAMLVDATYSSFIVKWSATLASGLEEIDQGGIKAVLLNLALSDSQGIDTFDKLHQIANDIPIVILSDAINESSALQAIQHGAQDYFLDSHINSYALAHALHNVIARQVVEEALFIETERARVTLNSIGDAVITADLDGNVTYLNLVAERMTGWSREEAAGRPQTEVLKIIDNKTREPVCSPLLMAINANEPVGLVANSVLIRRDGIESPIEDSAAPIHDRGGRLVGAVMVFHDVSESRAMSIKMSHLALHDVLTNLPNRALFQDRLTQAISFALRRRKQLAVLFLDLDHFKTINDSFGHRMGDTLLQSVAARLLNCVRDSDTVCRHGGDEFVILLSDIECLQDAADRAEHILSSMDDVHEVAWYDLNINISIGISIYPVDGVDAEDLIHNADAAMYHAKQNGRNNFQFFRKEINDQSTEQYFLEVDLRRAVAGQEFVLHYQPIVSLETGIITCTEALIRWQHPERGLLLPGEFVPTAEKSGLIGPIGRWVLREACMQLNRWLDAGLMPCPTAVNISAAEFRGENFLEGVCDILKETHLDTKYLEFELTESILMHDKRATTILLKAIKKMGIKLTIDDFGTGYSSLSYLKRFPIDILKIDRSFINDIITDHDDRTIVCAVINMCNSLNKRVRAEGVETWGQLEFLRGEHCVEGQGYLFSRPLTAEAYTELLTTGLYKPAYHLKDMEAVS
jgi:diguanylate cyclase (GGDEF)-like protein/PAS domain S-box-containing protein